MLFLFIAHWSLLDNSLIVMALGINGVQVVQTKGRPLRRYMISVVELEIWV